MSLALYLARVRSNDLLGAGSRCESLASAHVFEIAHLRNKDLSIPWALGWVEDTNHCDNGTVVIPTRASEFPREPFRSAKRDVRPSVRTSEAKHGARAPLISQEDAVCMHIEETADLNSLPIKHSMDFRKIANALLRVGGRCHVLASPCASGSNGAKPKNNQDAAAHGA